MTLLGMGLSAFFVSRTIAGYFSAQVAADKTSRWDSDTCGTWRLNSNASGERAAALNDILYMREKESRAGEYARNFYGPANSTLQSMRWNFFYRKKIPYTAGRPWDCPFGDEVCSRYQPSITFDTGLIDANDIGVNSKSPLSSVAARAARLWAWKISSWEKKPATGPQPTIVSMARKVAWTTRTLPLATLMTFLSLDTWSGKQEPTFVFHWIPLIYCCRTYITTHPEKDFWKPIPSLRPAEFDISTTIILVSALRLFYPEVNNDPIFPADKRFNPNDDEVWYYKSNPRATAIACSDLNELCSQNGTVCWPLDGILEDMKYNSVAITILTKHVVWWRDIFEMKLNLITFLLLDEQ